MIVGEKKKRTEKKKFRKKSHRTNTKVGTISKYKKEERKLWPYSLRHCVHDSYKFCLLPPYRPSQLKPESLEGKRRVGGEEEDKVEFFFSFCIYGFQSKFGR